MAHELKQSLASIPEILRTETDRVFAAPLQQTANDDPWSEVVLHWLKAYALRSGKGIRPWLVAVGSAAANGTSVQEALSDAAVRRAMIITELIHKRLLLADDIADRDELRNDEPSFHIQVEQYLEELPQYAALTPENRQHLARSFSEIAGIWLQQIISQELQLLVKEMPVERWLQLSTDFDRHTYQCTVAGWFTLLDQNISPLDDAVSRQRFLKGLELQTAHYSFISPLFIGQAFGAENNALRTTTEKFGKAIGVLFQLSDDVLGLFGDPKKTGKPVGGDIREGKKTLFVQELYARVDGEDRSKLQSLVGNANISHEDLEWVQALVHSSGTWDAVQKTVDEYRAVAELAIKAWPHTETQLLLQQLTALVAQREK